MDKTALAVGRYDPIFFAEFFLGISLNTFQKRALLAFQEGVLTGKFKEFLFVTANQTGKTFILAVCHLWMNFYKIGLGGSPEFIEKCRYETLNISPVQRQSREGMRYAEEILGSNWSWEENGIRKINNCRIGWFFEGKNENVGRIDFSNNSSLYCLSTSEDQGAGLAGKQFAFISYDECVQSLHLEEELPARIFSRTAKYSGPVALTSTPDDLAKSQQFWYHLYTETKKGKGNWKLVEGIYDDNIFIPEKIREEYKKRLFSMSPEKYKQVILGQFIASADRMFLPEVVEGLWDGKKEKTEPLPDHHYVEVVDWGVADSGDETVINICDDTVPEKAEIVFAWSKGGGDPTELMAMVGYLKMEYNDADLVMDAYSMGGAIFKKMLSRLNPIPFPGDGKADALMALQILLRNNLKKGLTKGDAMKDNTLKSYYLPKLQEQLSTYKIEDKKIKQDWVMVLAMLAWYLDKYRKANRLQTFEIKSFYK